MNKNTTLAKLLRKNMTPQEKIMWNILRAHKFYGYEFRRQYPIGNYIVDFICRDKKIIIEIDGGQHNKPNEIASDLERTEYLNKTGYKVIRFWNNDVDNNLEGIFLSLKKEFGISE